MKDKKILIVDDDTDVLMALRVRLTSRGYATVCATNAMLAVQAAVVENPDLIVLDLGLPDDNGFVVMEVLQRLTSLANIPVIVVSSRPVEVYRNASLLAGAREYLKKPFENDALLSAIAKELAPSSASAFDIQP